MDKDNLFLIACRNGEYMANAISEYLSVEIKERNIKNFPDGEIFVQVKSDVRGKHCYVFQSLGGNVNENIMELFILISTLKRASAKTITVVIPYFAYARQDRKTSGRTPITAKLIADLLTNAGADRILTIDMHAAQIEGFFNIPVDHLKAFPIFLDYFKDIKNAVMVSPDVGNIKMAEEYAKRLNIDIAIINKKRINEDTVKTNGIIGNVKGKNIIMSDDIISTAGTICSAASILKDEGANEITVAASHGLFCNNACNKIDEAYIDKIVTTDTISFKNNIKFKNTKLEIVSVLKLIAEAINRIHHNKSVSILFD